MIRYPATTTPTTRSQQQQQQQDATDNKIPNNEDNEDKVRNLTDASTRREFSANNDETETTTRR